ncbi:cellulase family glycosylhydrolase [bacterium]|nr:cellulase family glycosylhydrolase [bacterium]
MRKLSPTKSKQVIKLVSILLMFINAQAYFTTNGQDIVSRNTGEVVQLRGIGLGGWLLPEGYMWGSGQLNRPRQLEAAIEDLIGQRNARKFWTLYYENFVTKEDVEIMRSWGVNTLRIPLLASMIQPRENQPAYPPYLYSEENFEILDNLVDWCEEIGMGVIWDLHGAPGGQNAENISDSDGRARLWTESEVYWPLTLDLWDKITRRYVEYKCIVGYDLLNEPLLARYPGVDPGMLRQLYLKISRVIRETDTDGIIFIEGDDWAQNFNILEPLDWDSHLVLAFHSYPPSSSQNTIQRWDDLRDKYDIPLWHGETGEQDPPWEVYKRSTEFLETANIGWNWWTHKKFELSRQPWSISRTDGFERLIDYWNGKGQRPGRWQAKRWLFDQARKTNTKYCDFMPGMVESLKPLDPSIYVQSIGIQAPTIIEQPRSQTIEDGYGAILSVKTRGYPISYQWYRNGELMPGADMFQIVLHHSPRSRRAGQYHVIVSNEMGSIESDKARIEYGEFTGVTIPGALIAPIIDGEADSVWQAYEQLDLNNLIIKGRADAADLSAWYKAAWDSENLYFLVSVKDDILSTNSSIDYMKDGIEIYLDVDNSKSSFYGNDDFQLRCILDSPVVGASIGNISETIILAQKKMSGGYQMELSIPWNSISSSGAAYEFLGLDIHVNDNDTNTRDAKIAWWATRDNSYQKPSVFGTLKLK